MVFSQHTANESSTAEVRQAARGQSLVLRGCFLAKRKQYEFVTAGEQILMGGGAHAGHIARLKPMVAGVMRSIRDVLFFFDGMTLSLLS
ncbi:MAG: hypothetical protein WD468_01990 [Pirellulales bacterium]